MTNPVNMHSLHLPWRYWPTRPLPWFPWPHTLLLVLAPFLASALPLKTAVPWGSVPGLHYLHSIYSPRVISWPPRLKMPLTCQWLSEVSPGQTLCPSLMLRYSGLTRYLPEASQTRHVESWTLSLTSILALFNSSSLHYLLRTGSFLRTTGGLPTLKCSTVSLTSISVDCPSRKVTVQKESQNKWLFFQVLNIHYKWILCTG